MVVSGRFIILFISYSFNVYLIVGDFGFCRVRGCILKDKFSFLVLRSLRLSRDVVSKDFIAVEYEIFEFGYRMRWGVS